MEQPKEEHIAAVLLPEARITVLLIAMAAVTVLPRAAVTPAETAAVARVRHTAAVVAAVPVHPVAVAVTVVAEEDK